MADPIAENESVGPEVDDEAKLPRLAPPKSTPFRNVHLAYKVLFLGAAAAGLAACPGALPAWAAPPAYAAWYLGLLNVPIGARHAPSMAVWLGATMLLAGAAGVAGAAVLAAVAWLVSYAGVRYEEFPPLPERHTLTGTIKASYHWAKYFYPGPRHLAACGAAAAACAACAVPAAQAAPFAALAAAALLNETRLWWFARRTRLLPVDEHSRAVIEAQAARQGLSVAEFSRVYLGMFGESPLVLPDWKWRACHSDGPPCFCHNYVDSLGINTPPCCRQRLADMAHTVQEAAKEAGLPVWIDGGSLLGPLRHEGDWVPWEDDVDMAYLAPGGVALRGDSPQLRAIGKAVERAGYTWTVGDAPNFYVHATGARKAPFPLDAEVMRREPWRHLHLDLIPSFERNGKYVVRKKLVWDMVRGRWGEGWQIWNRELVLPLGTVEARGYEFAAPADPGKYLFFLYGDWHRVAYTFIKYDTARLGRYEPDLKHMERLPLARMPPPPSNRVINSSDSDWSD